ncbi:DUF899 domain-containing protein [Actinoplanes rectilineatus]|uniref:DUF899 domain-containing protein n=1 Tax=Actinoplanes rectilineatus TaxID=113571 RepID=UPI001B8080F5
MESPRIVSREQWLTARRELLAREDASARALAELEEQRRSLPMVEIDQEYVFEGRTGKATLPELFEGRGQLIVYHFMFDPSWDAGCKFCSYLIDNLGDLSHLHARDTTIAVVSRAPYPRIEAFQERMGWTVPWYSSYGSRFNYDFHTTQDETIAAVEYLYRTKDELIDAGLDWMTQGEQAGLSVFLRRDDAVYHTYSTYGDGTALLHGIDNYLAFTPQGRPRLEEKGGWLRHHDKYREGQR